MRTSLRRVRSVLGLESLEPRCVLSATGLLGGGTALLTSIQDSIPLDSPALLNQSEPAGTILSNLLPAETLPPIAEPAAIIPSVLPLVEVSSGSGVGLSLESPLVPVAVQTEVTLGTQGDGLLPLALEVGLSVDTELLAVETAISTSVGSPGGLLPVAVDAGIVVETALLSADVAVAAEVAANGGLLPVEIGAGLELGSAVLPVAVDVVAEIGGPGQGLLPIGLDVALAVDGGLLPVEVQVDVGVGQGADPVDVVVEVGVGNAEPIEVAAPDDVLPPPVFPGDLPPLADPGSQWEGNAAPLPGTAGVDSAWTAEPALPFLPFVAEDSWSEDAEWSRSAPAVPVEALTEALAEAAGLDLAGVSSEAGLGLGIFWLELGYLADGVSAGAVSSQVSAAEAALPPEAGGPVDAASDLSGFQQALDDFLNGLTDLVAALGSWLARLGPYPWLLMALAVALTAIERVYRRRWEQASPPLPGSVNNELAATL